MKRLLSLALFSLLAAATVSAQSTDRAVRNLPSGGNAPPITNPEPMTLVALAGGAAVAGGLLRRRKLQQR